MAAGAGKTACVIGAIAALAYSLSCRAEPPAPDARVEQSVEAFALCDTKLSTADELKAALRAEAVGPERMVGDRLAMEHDERAQIAVKRYTYGCRDANIRLLKEQFRSLQKEP